jgi:hypothetical protein
MKTSLCLFCAVLLTACASTNNTGEGSGAPQASSTAATQIGQAATTPLSDLNLVRADIPAALATALKGPYLAPADRSCSALTAEVQALDAALGADLDTPVTASNPSLVEREASAAAVGALRGAAEGVVPFRGWIRKLSGAEKYSKEVAAAIAAGSIRRAFLKGLGQSAGCQAPAAPRS